MNFKIEPQIFEKFPNLVVAVVVGEGIDNSKSSPFMDFLSLTCAECFDTVAAYHEMGTHPAVRPWREAYAQFGAKPSKFRSSIEALLRRVQKNTPFSSINALVDLYNALSIKYQLPCGAEDLDAIKGDFRLAFANGSEKGVCLGESEESTCEPGEVAYLDQVGFVCRRWNWREADRTKITENTKRCIFVSEALSHESIPALENLTQEFIRNAQKELGGSYTSRLLSASGNL